MVKCFIVNCKTGYASNKDKFSLFGVPKDPLLFVKWKNIIPKRERELMTNSAVCSKHFEPSQIIREWTSGHIKKFFGTVRQAGCQNDHPAMPTFLQLYRLLSTYKLLKPPKFGNCTISEDDTNNGTLSLEEFKNIFDNDNPSNIALQRLKIRLDSIIECEQWDEEDEIASNSSYISNPEVVDIAIYYASGYNLT